MKRTHLFYKWEGLGERKDGGRRCKKGEIPFFDVIVAKMCVLCTVFVSFLFELISFPNEISTI